MKIQRLSNCLILIILLLSVMLSVAQPPVIPSVAELNGPFGKHDLEVFRKPPLVFHPQTWFHYIGGNVSKEGITADLEAIAKAGISGIQLFHGQFGGPWPGVVPQIASLSPSWDGVVKHTAEECHRLGLRFTMQNCPGWSMSGGPWIEPSNSMRNLVVSRTDIVADGNEVNIKLAVPQPSNEPWRDYKDITVLAFPTPLDDSDSPLVPQRVTSNLQDLPWMDCLSGNLKAPFILPPAPTEHPNWIEVTFANEVALRTIELSSIQAFYHQFCYEPGVSVTVQAVSPDGKTRQVFHSAMPQSNWQDDQPISLACDEVNGIKTYRVSIVNNHQISLGSLRLFSAARKNNWESEAGWTLRSIVREGAHPRQSPSAFVDSRRILDITAEMDSLGHLKWKAPLGKWTILRMGHINTGMKNGPAPIEGTGWECTKLSESGPNAQFAGYIGRLIKKDGAISGKLNGMLLDSWECKTQTWTPMMEQEFNRVSGYELRKWLPAVFGYVISDHETTTRFLRDWRATISDLITNKFYGRMAKLAKDNGLTIEYETGPGDVFPADILEYFKFADVPMCEFWKHSTDSFVGTLNFKPIKPTASAARLYGKPRVSAEAFTSFELTWDEHLSSLKEIANINCIEGVSHLIFHTYTHNPRTDFLPPGSSFGSGIGTPFLRGQTWWKHMPEFTSYLSRCTYLLERGKPVSDVLWYLGDEINHKPDQLAYFTEGFKYDYCNPDVLLTRLSVQNGLLVTPEGISYRLLWLPDNTRMLPQTLEKMLSLLNEGATIIGDPPQGLATLTDPENAQKRFETAVTAIWGDSSESGMRTVGKGKVIKGMSLAASLAKLNIEPDVTGGKALWSHRKTDGADWYYVCAPKGSGFNGLLNFHNSGNVEIWDPLTGTITQAPSSKSGNYTQVQFDLPQAGSCFVVFQKAEKSAGIIKYPDSVKWQQTIPLAEPWKITFPFGKATPVSITVKELKAWKDLDLTPESKAFSGTATYTTTFDVGKFKKDSRFLLDLGRVEMIAVVSLNGKPIRTLWTPPYKVDLSDAIKSGINKLTVEVTSTWFNRLVYDAGLPEAQRKTWTINGPSRDAALRESGLIGPVILNADKK